MVTDYNAEHISQNLLGVHGIHAINPLLKPLELNSLPESHVCEVILMKYDV